MISEKILNTKLVDDGEMEYGGVSFEGETLRDFLESIDADMDIDLEEANILLVECGIRPIIEW